MNHIKRIIVVGMTENPGGIETLFRGLTSVINKDKVHFDFLNTTPHIAFEDELREYGAHIYTIRKRHDNRIGFHRDLAKFMQTHAKEYDAIWQNSNTLGNIDFLVYAKRAGIQQRIIHCHNSVNGEGFIRGVLHNINRLRIKSVATHFWSASDEASAWFYGHGFQQLPNYHVFNNTIDVPKNAFSQTKRESLRTKFGWDKSVLVLGNVGRLSPQKNQKLILQTAKYLIDNGVNVQVLLIGQGELDTELTEFATELNIANHVKFLGAVNDTSPYLSAMDIFFFPSAFEGLSLALLEAQANSLPCVISSMISSIGILNENVYTVPIDETPAKWASAILEAHAKGRTNDNRLFGSRFDLDSESLAVQNLLVS